MIDHSQGQGRLYWSTSRLNPIKQIASEASEFSDKPDNTYDCQEDTSDEVDYDSDHTEDCLDKNEIIGRICGPDLEYNDWISTSVQKVKKAQESKKKEKERKKHSVWQVFDHH